MHIVQSRPESRPTPTDDQPVHLLQVSKTGQAQQATEASLPPPCVSPPAIPTDNRGWPAVCESDIEELLRGTLTPATLTTRSATRSWIS